MAVKDQNSVNNVVDESPLKTLVRAPARMASGALTKTMGYAARHVQDFTEHPEEHGKNGERIYGLLKRYAVFVGVNKIFIDRADEIYRSTRSLAEAMRFLKNYIKLEQGKPIGGVYDDFISRLKTNDEIELTKGLIKLQLEETDPGANYNNLQVQLFRLCEAKHDDLEVIAFVRDNLEKTIATRLKSFRTSNANFRENAFKTLLQAKEVFAARDHKFFLIAGTLLGAVRDKDFLCNETHIDLGIFAGETSLEVICDWFAKAGFTSVEETDDLVRLKSRLGVEIRFFLTTRENGHLWQQDQRNIHRWYFSDFDLVEYEFQGHKFWIPDQYEKNLEENFGNWRERPLFFDSSYDPPARLYKHDTDALLYLTNLACNAISRGSRYWAHEPIKSLRDYFDIDFTDSFPRPVIEPALPSNRFLRTIKPILVLGKFDKLEPHTVRILQSAGSLNDQVIAGVLGDKSSKNGKTRNNNVSTEDRLSLAKEVRYIHDAYVETALNDGDLAAIVALSPDVILVDENEVKNLPDGLEKICKVISYGAQSICLTKKSSDQYIVRNRVVPTNGLGQDVER